MSYHTYMFLLQAVLCLLGLYIIHYIIIILYILYIMSLYY